MLTEDWNEVEMHKSILFIAFFENVFITSLLLLLLLLLLLFLQHHELFYKVFEPLKKLRQEKKI